MIFWNLYGLLDEVVIREWVAVGSLAEEALARQLRLQGLRFVSHFLKKNRKAPALLLDLGDGVKRSNDTGQPVPAHFK